MGSFEDLDAQLAELQAELKLEITKNDEPKIEWPEVPDLQSLNVKTTSKSAADKDVTPPPATASPSPSSKSQSASISSKSSSSSKEKADEDAVDKLTDQLVKNMNEPAPPGSNAQDFVGTCDKCSKPIDGYEGACSAMGHYYHITCLICTKCSTPLHGEQFVVVGNDEPFCESCHDSNLERCTECKEPIKSRILRAAGSAYHPECFVCSECNKSLDGIPFTQDDHKKHFCIPCFHSTHSPKCESCSNPITPEPGETDALRIIALDKSYHKKCFTCRTCLAMLSDPDVGGCYPVDGVLFCKNCSTIALKEKSHKRSN
jgi:hypothetical protein